MTTKLNGFSNLLNKIFLINKNYNDLVSNANISDDNSINVNVNSNYNIEQHGGQNNEDKIVQNIRQLFLYQKGGNYLSNDSLSDLSEGSEGSEFSDDEKYKAKYYKYKTKYCGFMANKN
jgi:hypothetical protein